MGRGRVLIILFFLLIAENRGLPSEDLHLIFLYTANTQGNLEGCGCSKNPLGDIRSRATLIRYWKNRDRDHTVLIDAGDAFISPRLYEAFNLARRNFLIKTLNYIGYDLLNIGDTEFGFSRKVLLQIKRQLQPTLISANILDRNSRKPLFSPYVIREVEGVRVGFLGLITDRLPARIPPANLQGISISSPLETARRYVPLLKKKSDLVVILGHLGMERAISLAKEIPDINIIIEGHGEEILHDPLQINRTLLCYPGDRGQYVGRLVLTLDQQKRISSYENRLIPVDQESYPPDELVDRWFKAYVERERSGQIYGQDDRREKLVIPLLQSPQE